MKFSVYLLAVLAVLGGLFLYFKPHDPNPPASPKIERTESSVAVGPTGAPAPTQAGVPAPPQVVAPAPLPPLIFDLMIRRERLVAGPSVIQVHQGDELILRITSDGSDELHLHGYDLHAKLRPGETTTLQFSATRTGRFGYELHHAGVELGALEVYPR